MPIDSILRLVKKSWSAGKIKVQEYTAEITINSFSAGHVLIEEHSVKMFIAIMDTSIRRLIASYCDDWTEDMMWIFWSRILVGIRRANKSSEHFPYYNN